MTLSVEHFHSTTHVKNVLMTQLQYAREFMRSIKEALKSCHSCSACYFTSRKVSWYPPTEDDINFRNISSILPSKAVPSSLTVAGEETLRTWANAYKRGAIRQRTVRQETGMAKTGTLPHYLYTAKISEVAERTEESLILLIVPTDVSTAVVNKKEVVIEEVQEDDNEPSSDEEEELDNAHPNIATSTTDVAGLDEGSLFLVGRLTRSGLSIKINSKFIP